MTIFPLFLGGPGVGKTASILEYRLEFRRGQTFFLLNCESKDMFMADLRKHVRKHRTMTLADEDYSGVKSAVKSLVEKLVGVGDPFMILFDDASPDVVRQPLLDALNEEDPQTISQ